MRRRASSSRCRCSSAADAAAVCAAGFQPVLESPVTILDADRPIGTHVFTAMERTGDDAGIRWSVVSLHDGSRRAAEPASRGRAGQEVKPVSTGADGAKAALERIVIPQDTLDRIAGDGVAAIVPDCLG